MNGDKQPYPIWDWAVMHSHLWQWNRVLGDNACPLVDLPGPPRAGEAVERKKLGREGEEQG